MPVLNEVRRENRRARAAVVERDSAVPAIAPCTLTPEDVFEEKAGSGNSRHAGRCETAEPLPVSVLEEGRKEKPKGSSSGYANRM